MFHVFFLEFFFPSSRHLLFYIQKTAQKTNKINVNIKHNPAKYINAFQIYRNTFSFIGFCVVCILLDHMKYHVTQRIDHIKFHVFDLVYCVKLRIFVEFKGGVIHEIQCSKNCEKKTGSTVRFPFNYLF